MLHGSLELLRRRWPVLRWVLSLGLLGVAVYVLSGHTSELSGFYQILGHLRWWWVLPALAAEGASFAAFTAVEYQLLRAGGLRPPVWPLGAITFASQAITNSLLGGQAIATVYGFRWFRRFGADDALALWALAGTLVTAGLSLTLVAAVGMVLALEQGATLDLIPVVVGALAVMVAFGALFLYERWLAVSANWALRTSHRLIGRPRGDLETTIATLVARITAVRLGWRRVLVIVGWGAANWLADCACFAISFLVVGAGIPWKGLLLAYGAGQLAANLPITPGGLGAVEGSITIALVYFGGAQVAAIDAVLIYRLISFWLVLVVGWAAWSGMALAVRRGRWSRTALHAPALLVDPPELAADPPRLADPTPSSGGPASAGGPSVGEP